MRRFTTLWLDPPPILLRPLCWAKGHMWDSLRPSGAVHLRDICWRCEAVREPNNARHR